MQKDITQYLDLMVRRGASDIFFTVGAPVSLSINGQIRPVGHDVLDAESCRGIIFSLLSDSQIRTFENTHELNMALSFAGIGRFRANVYRQKGEVAMVLRYIKAEVPSFEQLGLPASLAELVMASAGLVLVVGATGSGKSTTLAAMIDYRNSRARDHIVTIEDPIEFIHPHKRSLVDQREVGLDTASYDVALENALREAPNVIVIGEIRDHNAMKHALHYSETGHLCLSTLHASNALQTLERILNFFPDTSRHNVMLDLSQHLRAIVAQRLLPAKEGGRVPAVELLLNTPFISELIEQGRISEIRDAVEKGHYDGMQTFDQALYTLVHEGRISVETALDHADSRNNLSLKLRLELGAVTNSQNKLSIDESS